MEESPVPQWLATKDAETRLRNPAFVYVLITCWDTIARSMQPWMKDIVSHTLAASSDTDEMQLLEDYLQVHLS